jgi:hypothetical protein
VGGRKPFEDLERAGLAGAVGPEQAEDLAPLDHEADAPQDLAVAVALLEPLHLDDRTGVGNGHVAKIRLCI